MAADESRAYLRVGVSLVAYVGAAWAFVEVRDRGALPAVLAILAVALLGIRLHRVATVEFLRDGVGGVVRWGLILGVIVAGAGLVLWSWRAGNDFGFFGLALLYVGAGLLLEQVRGWRDGHWRFVLVFGVTAGMAAFGIVLIAVGVPYAPAIAALGILTAPIGIALASEAALTWLEGLRQRAWVFAGLFVGGAVLLAMALAVAGWRWHVTAPYVALAGGAAVVLMIVIAARSNVDVVLVLAAAAVVWTLGHRSVPEPASLRPEPGEPVVVALGDSYISGEGAEAYYEGTNVKGGDTCRRAPTAYPPLAILERNVPIPAQLLFLACSGAKAGEVVDRQLPSVSRVPTDDIDFVLVSAGGNDALFGTLAQACLLPVDCTRLRGAWMASLPDVRETLDEAYGGLRRALPGTPVAVVPYPAPVARHTCGSSAFSNGEHQFLDDFAGRLNATIAAEAGDHGFYVVDTMPSALEQAQLRLCDGAAGEVGVNFLAANSVFGTLQQSTDPRNWVHNSLHPNARGHEAMRAALVTWRAEQPEELAVQAPDALHAPNPPVDDEVAGGPCVGKSGDELAGCANEWMARGTASQALRWSLVLALLLVGAWLIALPVVGVWEAIFRDRSGPAGSQATQAAPPATDAKDDG
jgi:GDSL-like Lipase/Acylhydrolase family